MGNGFISPPLVKSTVAPIDREPQRYFHLLVSWILAVGGREASTFIWVKSPGWRNSQRGSFIRQAQSNISNIQSKCCIRVVIFALAWQWRAGDLRGPGGDWSGWDAEWCWPAQLGWRWHSQPPDRFLNTYISRQPICLPPKIYSSRLVPICQKKTCHLKKKKPNLTLTDRSALLS